MNVSVQTNEEMKEELKSRAKKVRTLFTKQKKLLGSYYKVTAFKEPFAMLRRRSGNVEMFEDATKGFFEFEHSDGTKRQILLTPNMMVRLTFLNNDARGYWLSEDNPLPLPEDPLLTAEQMNIGLEKALNDMAKWKAKEIEAKSGMIKVIGFILVGLVLAYTVYKLLVGDPVVVEKEVLKEAVQNTTIIVRNATVIQ